MVRFLARLLLLVALPLAGLAEPPSSYKVEAAFIFNFLKFVEWSENVFETPQSPYIIGVFGKDPFGSALEGTLRNDLDALDAFAACFPAGTLSGAPKVRAMQIIEELEPTRRGIYGGSVLYADFAGNLDSCIGIRTLLMQGKKAYLQAGGGVVADSDPASEFQDSVNKAKALLRAVEMARNSRG